MHVNQPIKIQGCSYKEYLEIEQLWNYRDLANYLKMSENTLRRYVMEKRIPFTKIGKCVRFKQNEIDEWLDGKSVEVSNGSSNQK